MPKRGKLSALCKLWDFSGALEHKAHHDSGYCSLDINIFIPDC